MSSLLSQLPTSVYPLAAGLFVNSGLFFGNLGLGLCGPLPIIKGDLGPNLLSTKQKLRTWTLFFDKAATLVVGGTALTAALNLGAIPLLPTPELKLLATASAILSISIIPYTMVVIQPTNKRLKQLDRQPELSKTEENEVDMLIRKWDTLHKVRYAGYGSAWATTLLALHGVAAAGM